MIVVIPKIVTWFEEWYGALFYDIDNPSAENIRREMIEGDSMLSKICKVLSTKVCPDNELLVNEHALQKQLESISFMYQHYHTMPIFTVTLRYQEWVFVFSKIFWLIFLYIKWCLDSLDISNNLDKYLWKKTLQSNAALERFFRYVRYVKSDLRTILLLQSF